LNLQNKNKLATKTVMKVIVKLLDTKR